MQLIDGGGRCEVIRAFVYCVSESTPALKAVVDGGGGGLSEYELETHHYAMYNPIKVSQGPGAVLLRHKPL